MQFLSLSLVALLLGLGDASVQQGKDDALLSAAPQAEAGPALAALVHREARASICDEEKEKCTATCAAKGSGCYTSLFNCANGIVNCICACNNCKVQCELQCKLQGKAVKSVNCSTGECVCSAPSRLALSLPILIAATLAWMSN